MKTRYPDELVKDLFLLVPAGGPIRAATASISSRLVVTLNCPLNLLPVPFNGMGNIFHEATGRAG